MFLFIFSLTVSAASMLDDEGEKVEGYILGTIIGYGGFSTIRCALSPSDGSVAVKLYAASIYLQK